MIVRVGTLSEVGKVEFADTDGLEAVDVFAVVFVDPLDSEYELVAKDEALELFEESSDIVVCSLVTVGEVENVFTGEDERVLINELSLVYAVLEFAVGKLGLTDVVPSDEMRDALDVPVELFVDSDVMTEEGAVYTDVSVLSDDFETLFEVV